MSHLFARKFICVALAAGILAGCVSPPSKKFGDNIPSPSESSVPSQAVGKAQDAVTEVPLAPDWLQPETFNQSTPLPQVVVGPLTVSGQSLETVVRTLLQGTGVSVSFDADAASYANYSAFAVKGKLEDVVNDISERTGLWWRYEKGILRFSANKSFIVSVPPFYTGEARKSLGNMLQQLGVTRVALDDGVGTLTYQASRESQELVADYLSNLRSRSLLIYDVYIMDVSLSDNEEGGVKWDQFSLAIPDGTLGLAGGITGSADGFGLSTLYSKGDISVNALISFLATQGKVRTVAQPQIAMLSGQTGSFSVGENELIISQVGSTIGTGVSSTSATTSELKTGLQVLITGSENAGEVYTRVKLLVSALLDNRMQQVGDTTLYLPKTSQRELETFLRARPGDAVIIGGLISERDEAKATGIPLIGRLLQMGDSKVKTRSELVVMLRPKMVRFITPPAEQKEEKPLVSLVVDAVSASELDAIEAVAELAGWTDRFRVAKRGTYRLYMGAYYGHEKAGAKAVELEKIISASVRLEESK